jgi:hypothetical protein
LSSNLNDQNGILDFKLKTLLFKLPTNKKGQRGVRQQNTRPRSIEEIVETIEALGLTILLT